MQHWIEGIGIGLAISCVVGSFLPGFVVRKMHEYFEAAKVSPWWRNPAKTWRWELLKALAHFLEQEIPDEDSPEENSFYDKWANRIVSWLAFIPILRGTAGAWAKALCKAGRKLDTEIKADIKEM